MGNILPKGKVSNAKQISISKGEICIIIFEVLIWGLALYVAREAFIKTSLYLGILGSILFCAALSVFVIRCIASRNFEMIFASYIFICAFVLILFGISSIIFTCIGLVFICILAIGSNVRKISKLLIKKNIWIITRNGLEFSLVFLALAVSLLYFESLQKSGNSNQGAIDIMRHQGKLAVERLIMWKIPEYNQSMTIDQLTARLSEELSKSVFDKFRQDNLSSQEDIGNSNGEINFGDIPKDQQDAIIASQKMESQKALKQELDKSINNLLNQYGIEPDGDIEVGSVLDQLIGAIIQRILGPIMPWLAHFMAGQLFLCLVFLTPIYQFLIRLFALVIKELFIAVGVIRKIKENKEVEQLEF